MVCFSIKQQGKHVPFVFFSTSYVLFNRLQYQQEKLEITKIFEDLNHQRI